MIMGQAKQRGTFAERQLKAQQRNLAIQTQIQQSPSMRPFVQRFGTQRLVTKLVMAGAFLGMKR